ncbi:MULTISPECIES: tripartite tricarboxylate transporter TctB family protein [Marinomonas]|uniref:Tripartite tricarboxylate transporter TctB family protein n=1 Tax=Marinomonas balearica TaxID=491947 RepID=A0A4R6MBK1_9GAMM|nr:MULTISPECIES: tripartite tricarboxylate transporter TctB family protein [Marinomonas]TDO98987.1 tripartite tricarboxylate transporter TctB family protein [Marinomonas balearica]WCN12788.1 tripartite tricarboxylate transporter TctB family protein [Marinomonas mediterranea]
MSSQFSAQKTRKPGERLFCFLLVLGSVYIFWQAYNISGFSELSSPGAFPLAASAVMILASCITFLNTLKSPAVEGMRFKDHCLPPIVAIVMTLILVYSVILESLGFILSSFAFLFVTIQFLYRRSILYTLSISLLALIVVYIIFRLVFQVVLPEGIVPEREILSSIKSLWR